MIGGKKPLERLVAADGNAIAEAALREIVPHGVVHDAAVIPEGDGVLPPLERHCQFGFSQWRYSISSRASLSSLESCVILDVKIRFTNKALRPVSG